jgi:hypothetical protein
MDTIGRDKWPKWVKRVIGKRKGIEIKEDKGRYYAYQPLPRWDKIKKQPTRTSAYLGRVKDTGIVPPHEIKLHGIYEYGHIQFIWHVLQKNGILKALQKIFPDDWKVLLIFAMNRLIDPRPLKSMKEWCEKTYLVNKIETPLSPDIMARALFRVGLTWKSQLEFFESLKQDGEKILYDGSVIFSESGENPILETGYNKEHLFLTKANIVLAFSYNRFIPVFFRLLPGSVHEITSLDILISDLGKRVILVMDKGFSSVGTFKKLAEISFITPLKRNSKKINYKTRLAKFFMYKERPIKYAAYEDGDHFIYLFEDLSLRIEEEKTYYRLLSKGKKVNFREEWAGKIALISNKKFKAQDAYELWKGREHIEKSFHVLQNILDTDRPYVRKEETFRGYVFASFISLVAYYLILTMLKKTKPKKAKRSLNSKVSVGDLLLELSKVYKVEMGKRELLSEVSKKARTLMELLGITDVITKNAGS